MIISDNEYVIRQAGKLGIAAYNPYVGYESFFIRQIIKCGSALGIKWILELFMNPKILSDRDRKDVYVVVFDSLMTKAYLDILVKRMNTKKFVFWYWNPVCCSIEVKSVPKEFVIVTYSRSDAKKYNIDFHEQFFFDMDFSSGSSDRSDGENAVFFVGIDKGRKGRLLEYKEKLESIGIKTDFVIVDENKGLMCKIKRLFSQSSFMSYGNVVDRVKKCKVVFDYVLNRDDGLSLRPLEAVKYGKKLITNNINIVNCSFYDEKMVFLIGKSDERLLKEFCDEHKNIVYKDKEKYSFSCWYSDLCKI